MGAQERFLRPKSGQISCCSFFSFFLFFSRDVVFAFAALSRKTQVALGEPTSGCHYTMAPNILEDIKFNTRYALPGEWTRIFARLVKLRPYPRDLP